MKLRTLRLGDAIYVCGGLPPDDFAQLEAFGFPLGLDALAVLCYGLPGQKWTFASARYPLVIGGFVPQRPGVVSSWFLATLEAWHEHGAAVTEMAAERLAWAHANGAHRIETVCLASREKARRWYERIGLKFESTLKGYCVDGSDAVMYVSLKGGS